MSNAKTDKREEAEYRATQLFEKGEIEWLHTPEWTDWSDEDLYESLEGIGFNWDGFYWLNGAD